MPRDRANIYVIVIIIIKGDLIGSGNSFSKFVRFDRIEFVVFGRRRRRRRCCTARRLVVD